MFRVAVLQSAAVDRGDVPLGTLAQEDEWELMWERVSQSDRALNISFQSRLLGVMVRQVGSTRQNAATSGTRGYWRASHHAFDWRQRYR